MTLACLLCVSASAFAEGLQTNRPVHLVLTPHWSLTVQARDPLLYGPNPYLPAPLGGRTFADTIVDTLAAHDVRFKHSAFVIGRDFGNGWHLYIGRTQDSGSTPPGMTHMFGSLHHGGRYGIGVEYSIRF